jgi:hypothetical protein
VTGSTYGTAKDPKFPLKPFFEKNVFPAVEELVKVGGKYEGYLPVFQGDNAGPHTDAPYHKFVTESCKSRGWLWEPQGPQMPHVNVLDLAVFPSMSRRHSHLARSLHGNRVLKEDEIWNTALRVWEELPSCKIANAFVQAKRISEKIIQLNGDNVFLAGAKGGISSGIRHDFFETVDGNARKDGIKLSFDEGLIGLEAKHKSAILNDVLRDGEKTNVETAAAIPLPTPAISRTLNEGMEVVMPQLEIASKNVKETDKGDNQLVEM